MGVLVSIFISTFLPVISLILYPQFPFVIFNSFTLIYNLIAYFKSVYVLSISSKSIQRLQKRNSNQNKWYLVIY